MPPSLDIYMLTAERTRETIERFLATYTDRTAIEDRGDEELMFSDGAETPDSDERLRITWEPALSVTHSITRGLADPRRSLTLYYAAHTTPIEQVMVSFTSDHLLVLGLSIDDTGMQSSNATLARALLAELMATYVGQAGLVTTEQPPPLDARAFRALGQHPLTIAWISGAHEHISQRER